MEVAVAEICRVTCEGICAGFFGMHEEEDPIVRPVDDYHWNTLSLVKSECVIRKAWVSGRSHPHRHVLEMEIRMRRDPQYNAYTFFAASDEIQNSDDDRRRG